MDKCSFCGREKKEVNLLIAGIDGHICDRCAEQAYSIIQEEIKQDSSFTLDGVQLFAIRSELFEEVETDTILDDFIISLRIALRGYKISYTPDAYAEETASLKVKEELTRKIRIAAGGIQALFRLKPLLNPFRFGVLSWQYVSHKVLRWTIAPVSLFLLFILNAFIVWQINAWNQPDFYNLFFWFQVLCYLLAAVGWYFENRKIRFKLLFIPYYFLSINYAAIRGILRYFRGSQPAGWEKSKRA